MNGLGFQNCEHNYLRVAASSIIGKMENHCGGLMLTLTVPGMYTLNRNQLQSAICDQNLIIQKNCHKMAAISDLGVQQSLTGGDKSCVQLIFGLGAAAVAAMPQSGGEIFFGI